MIRPIRAETARYGDYSKAGEFVYDHPFLWGSKRTGPDLQREGGKYPDAWHFVHMREPSATSPRSIMPAYGWLYDAALDTSHIEGKIITLRRLGVPYPDGYERRAEAELKAQADVIATGLTRGGQAVTAGQGNHRAHRISTAARPRRQHAAGGGSRGGGRGFGRAVNVSRDSARHLRSGALSRSCRSSSS